MRVRISYVVEVSDHLRRAIRAHYGETGLATRAEIKRWYEERGSSCDDDAVFDYDRAQEEPE